MVSSSSAPTSTTTPTTKTKDPPPSFFVQLDKLLGSLGRCETAHPKAARSYLMRSLMNSVPTARDEKTKAIITSQLDPIVRCITASDRLFFGSHRCWLRSVPCFIYALTLLLYFPQNGVLVESTSPEFCDKLFTEQPQIIELCIKVLFWRSHDPEVFVELEDLKQQGKLFPGYSYEQMQDSTVRIIGRFLNGSINQIKSMAEDKKVKKRQEMKAILRRYANESMLRSKWIAGLPVSEMLGPSVTFGTSILDVMLHCVENPDLPQCLKGLLVIAQRLIAAAHSIHVLGDHSVTKLCQLASKAPGQIAAKTLFDMILSALQQGDDGVLYEAIQADMLETITQMLGRFWKFGSGVDGDDGRQERMTQQFVDTANQVVAIVVKGDESEMIHCAILKHAEPIKHRARKIIHRGHTIHPVESIVALFDKVVPE